MDEQDTTIRETNIAVGETTTAQETPFDRLEARIDTLIERYERLVSEHNQCDERLAAQETRINELQAMLEESERQKSEIRTRLDTLIEKLNRFS